MTGEAVVAFVVCDPSAGAVTEDEIRIVDTSGAVAGGAINADIAAIAGAVAKQVDATVTPVLLALQQMLSAVAATQASIANVLAQVQPKTTT